MFENGVVRKARHLPFAHDPLHRILARLAAKFVKDGEDLGDIAIPGSRQISPRQHLRNGVEERDLPGAVGHDHRVANACKRGAKKFFALPNLLAILLPQRHLAKDVVGQHHQADGGQQAGEVDAGDGAAYGLLILGVAG